MLRIHMLVFVLVTTGVSSAKAAEVSAQLEAGAVLALSTPQRDVYSLGATGAGSFHLGLAAAFDVFVRVGYLAVTRGPSSPFQLGGSSIDLGLGVRVHPSFRSATWAPFAQILGEYSFTGNLRRPGLRAQIGALFPIVSRAAWIGPVLGYQHIFGLNSEPAYQTRDASIVMVGIALEVPFGSRAADRDGDGVFDETDRCPDVAASGQPDGCPDDDPDQDGLRGAADECPTQPEDRDGFRDDDGCPEPDNDGDGLLDASDECPMDAGPSATRGCPDPDGDGVAGVADKCPKVAGPKQNAGCPVYKAIVVTDTNIELSQKIFFAYGLTKILPRSFPLLDEVVQALNDRTALCVRIEGHTDAVGVLSRNMTLSEGRAEAVKDYLVGHGVPSGNLESKGYGPTLPLASNATDVGREKNRRVEFVITPCPPGVVP